MPSPQLRYLTLLPCRGWVGTPLYPETCELRGDEPPCKYLYGPPPLWIPAMTELGGGEPPFPSIGLWALAFAFAFPAAWADPIQDSEIHQVPSSIDMHWLPTSRRSAGYIGYHRIHRVSNIRWTSSDIRSPALAFAFAFAGFFSSSASSSGTVSST